MDQKEISLSFCFSQLCGQWVKKYTRDNNHHPIHTTCVKGCPKPEGLMLIRELSRHISAACYRGWDLATLWAAVFSFIGHILVQIKICHNWVHVKKFLVTFLLLTIQPSTQNILRRIRVCKWNWSQNAKFQGTWFQIAVRWWWELRRGKGRRLEVTQNYCTYVFGVHS